MVKLAVIGAGNMARCHVEAAANLASVELTGIYSRTKDRSVILATNFDIGVIAHSIDELYALTKADGVVIAVNETSTETVINEALKHPWKLLVEKPVGLNLESTKRVCELATGNHADLFVAMNRRHYSSTRTALQLLDKTEGQRVVQIHDQEDPKSALANGRDKSVCDQWQFANSIHLIDLFHVFCRGDVAGVQNVVPWTSGYEAKMTHSIIQFESGDVGIYHSVWNGPGPWSVTISTSQKRIEMRPLEQLFVQNYPSRQLENVKLSEIDCKFKPGFFEQMKNFTSALRNDKHELLELKSYLQAVSLTDKLFSANIQIEV